MKLPVSRRSALNTLSYFDRFDYPLTASELRLWQQKPRHPVFRSNSQPLSLSHISISGRYYFLSGRRNLVKLRSQREKWSRSKWKIAKRVGEYLKQIPTIEGIFVTGSLAMNNCNKSDDIDLMIVASQNTLWLTRLAVVLFLKRKHLRRPPHLPEHSSLRVANTICDNLYLDSTHLFIRPHNSQSDNSKIRNLYLSHEILQAKCIFDRGNTHDRFLTANEWTKAYLPAAYRSQVAILKPQAKSNLRNPGSIASFVLFISNLLIFLPQYLYMKPKITTEKIALGFAFFHPRSTSQTNNKSPDVRYTP